MRTYGKNDFKNFEFIKDDHVGKLYFHIFSIFIIYVL
jgi:hypothetical protein